MVVNRRCLCLEQKESKIRGGRGGAEVVNFFLPPSPRVSTGKRKEKQEKRGGWQQPWRGLDPQSLGCS